MGLTSETPRTLLVTGAGGAPALNFIRSVRDSGRDYRIVGAECSKYRLASAPVDERYLVPSADEPDYIRVMQQVIAESGADFLFCQPDPEIAVVSERRDDLPVRQFLPTRDTVRICQDKHETYLRWSQAGLRVPQTRLIGSREDLDAVFKEYGDVWLRPTHGAAGRGAFHTTDVEDANVWIQLHDGWGDYTGAEYLTPQSVTWQSLWHHGKLIVAQGRLRLYWEFADRTQSGVTGITGAAITVSDPLVDQTALKAISAIDPEPHGIFSVDLTYDRDGRPNPTEINIGRFFTTHYFFTKAGLNMPAIMLSLAFDEDVPPFVQPINPLPAGLAWIRGMDMEPVLIPISEIERYEAALVERRAENSPAQSLSR